MHASMLLTTLAAATGTSAAMMRILAESITYEWDVINWEAGCARGGCYYNFNISAALNTTSKPQRPAFAAHCEGRVEGAPYSECSLIDTPETHVAVVSKLLPRSQDQNGNTVANIQVSMEHVDPDIGSTYYNYTGHAATQYNQFASPPINFTIEPDEVFGVA